MGKGNWPTWEESRRRREKAIELRKTGLSYKEIRAELGGGSMSSFSKWLRDIPLRAEHRARLLERRSVNGYARGRANRQRRLMKEARIRSSAASEMGAISDRELFIAGVVAYAAEGTKQKPWQASSRTIFINSDSRMIRLFLRWLDLLGVAREDLTFRIAIHEDADVTSAKRYWAGVVGVPAACFLQPTLKRGNPKTKRRNTGGTYRGCLVVYVRRSADLTRRIDGWFDALVAATDKIAVSGSSIPQPGLGSER